MPRSERCFNVLLGLSVLSWAVLGLVAAAETRPVVVRWVICALHVCAGILILCRGPVEKHGSLPSCLAAIPALLVGGLAFRSASTSWDFVAQLTFVVGGSLTIVSFLYLGPCFAILPAVRGTVTRGPFRVVRHPAYLGELLMILACWISLPKVLNLGPLVAAIPLVVLRIVSEEKTMAKSSAYMDYTGHVRWRLIPLVW